MTSIDRHSAPLLAVIDDEPIQCREIQKGLTKEGYQVETFPDGESAVKRMKKVTFDVVLSDLKLPGMTGLDLLKTAKSLDPHLEVIIITAYSSVDTAIEAIQAGAFHYLTKPIKMIELRALTARALEKVSLIRQAEALKEALFSRNLVDQEIIGHSHQMKDVFRLIDKVAGLTCNVLIQGESGTGKELVARALHYKSPRRDKSFVSFNCGGFTEELIANELFGHQKGAFTGAVETKIGLLEAAHKGTIFLDEIDEMPLSMQVKLLRFVEERALLRVGGVKPVKVDVRIIAAGNQDLKEAVKQETFREDLYYRLNVVVVALPPLRARTDDLPLLIQHFLAKYAQAFGKKVTGISPQAMDTLQRYPYPGNVRELENIIERAVALADESVIALHDLPSDLQAFSMSTIDRPVWPTLREKEREYIRQVLVRTNFKKGEAAAILGVPRTTLWRKMKEFGLT